MFIVEQEPIYLPPCVREHFFKSSNKVEYRQKFILDEKKRLERIITNKNNFKLKQYLQSLSKEKLIELILQMKFDYELQDCFKGEYI